MKPEGSFPCSEHPATCPYPESDQSSPHPPIQFIQDQLKYVSNSISKLQIQVTTYVFELSAGNCHR